MRTSELHPHFVVMNLTMVTINIIKLTIFNSNILDFLIINLTIISRPIINLKILFILPCTTRNFGFCNCRLQLKFNYMRRMQLQICVVA
jgi:hypothetical protein